MTARSKWRVAKASLPLVAPLAVVYLAEYFINQGLLELLYFPTAPLSPAQQYRWYQLAYQGGVFVARSSLRCCRLRRLWVLALLQGLNVGLVGAAVGQVLPLPGLAAALALIGYEGLLGGGTYAQAVAGVAEQTAPPEREFAMTVTALGGALGIGGAAMAAMAAHRALCPPP